MKPKLATQLFFGRVAHKAIQKYFNKSIKYQDQVLADQDPENLHQMRVGMRRLRTAINVFQPVILLPHSAQSPQVTKISKRLGKIRDLDVLQTWFEQFIATSSLSPKETKLLQKALNRLKRRRSKLFKDLPKLFKSKSYKKFVAAYESWLSQPHFNDLASIPILDAIPDLLLPLLSQLFLHPGWLVGTESVEDRPQPIMEMSDESLDQAFSMKGHYLHDLRKRIKQVRYQTELFIPFFDETYQSQVQNFQMLQDLLGFFQDEVVLNDFLVEQLGQSWTEKLPSLSKLLKEERLGNWKKWQASQIKYLDPKFRQSLCHKVMSPTVEVN